MTDPAPSDACTVLVVDNDADMRLYLSSCLARVAPGGVLEASDGTEALALARAQAPALVVSDIAMPGLDGLALCRALKADDATAAIPLLLISGETRAPPCADAVLAKPFNATTLRAYARSLLDA